jgi:cytochrome c-type biogenesis protein CcmE
MSLPDLDLKNPKGGLFQTLLQDIIPQSRRTRRRLWLFAFITPLLLISVGLALGALKKTEIYFYTPDQLYQAKVKTGETLRLGGLVKPGSVRKDSDGVLYFIVMDKLSEVRVSYKGDVPDLFREGQGVVCEGMMVDQTKMKAQTLLAKHDETYMPKNVADALKDQGEWRPQSGMTDKKPKDEPFGYSVIVSSSETSPA